MKARIASTADGALLAEMNHQLIRDEGHRNPMTAAELQQRMESWLASGEYGAVIFERDAQPLAYALYRADSDSRIYLRQFFVAREKRRKGIGRHAINLLRREILPTDSRLVVEVLTHNESGKRFWLSLGFQDYALTLELAPNDTSRPAPASPGATELPFNRFIGLERATEPSRLLKLPSGGQYLNHVGTVHASAQLALAEATSGEFLLRALGSILGIVPVVRRLDAKFRKPARGALTSSVTTPPDAIEQLRTDLAAKGRALVSVAVELHDDSGTHTLSASVEWFITRLPSEPATP